MIATCIVKFIMQVYFVLQKSFSQADILEFDILFSLLVHSYFNL